VDIRKINSMSFRPARLLCIGKEPDLLQTRCAVLSISGYDSQSATLPEAETLLQTEQYDLVIVSALMSKSERDRILAATGSTPTLLLTGYTHATDLLAQVERLLSRARSEVSK
jgi:DNA-binding response OmpR family regulator